LFQNISEISEENNLWDNIQGSLLNYPLYGVFVTLFLKKKNKVNLLRNWINYLDDLYQENSSPVKKILSFFSHAMSHRTRKKVLLSSLELGPNFGTIIPRENA
jgi:hypothetical protein